MGVKAVFHFLFLVVSISYVFTENWQCTAADKGKFKAYDCSCRENEETGFLIVECMYNPRRPSIADNILAILRKDFPKNTEFKLRLQSYRTPFNISSNYFEGLNISSLKFEECNIQNISDDFLKPAFVGLEDTLEVLKISHSLKFANTEYYYRNQKAPFTLDHLRRVREIKIENNVLWNMDDNMFAKGPKSLEILHLSFNRIHEIGARAFASLTNLREVNIWANTIHTIKRSLLPNPAPYLENIDFSSNAINELPIDMFDNMPSLKKINLWSNQIFYLNERTWMAVWSHLVEIDVHANFIHCGKKLEWFFKAKKLFNARGRCNSPPEHVGKFLDKLWDEKNGIEDKEDS